MEVNTEVSSRSSFPEFPLTGRVTRKLDGISWSRSLVFNLFSLSSFPRNLAKKNIYNRLSSRVKLNKSQTNFWDSKRRKWLIICKWDRLWIHYHFSSQETNRTQSFSKFQIDWWMNLRIEFRKKKIRKYKTKYKTHDFWLTKIYRSSFPNKSSSNKTESNEAISKRGKLKEAKFETRCLLNNNFVGATSRNRGNELWTRSSDEAENPASGSLCQGRAYFGQEGARRVVAAISIVSANFLLAVCLPRAIGTVKGGVHRPPI